MDVSYYDDLKQNLRHEKTCVACRLMIFGNYIQARLKVYVDLLKMIIPQAVTGVYHPLCFCCSVCTKPLGEENYSLDSENKVNSEQPKIRQSGIVDGVRFTACLTTALW